MHTVRDHQRLVDHAAAVADLLDLGVEEQVGVAALERPRAVGVDVLVERLADAADLGLADPQAEALDEMLDEIDEKIDKVIVLEAPDEELVERLSGRRQSEATGEIYHIEHNPPPEEGSEEDPGPFVQRDDDTEEAIRNRLQEYHEQTEPLKDYYEERGILVTVDASQDIDEVTEDVLQAVGADS